jgi:hypothetical protein
VERGGDADLLDRLRVARRLRGAEIGDAIGVIAIGGEVAADFSGMRVQDLVENRDLSQQHLMSRAKRERACALPRPLRSATASRSIP